MFFDWKDYTIEDANEIDGWLDETAVRYTAMDEGWNADVAYWKENTAEGKFWCKTVSIEGILTGALYIIGWDEGGMEGYTIGEVLLKPEARGKGLGTAMIKELLENSDDIIGKKMRWVEACVFASNIPSKRMFEKAGFTVKAREEDPSTLDALFN